MYRRLMAYLEINGILCDSQYGFREKHSTEHALIDIVNQVQSHFDEGMLSCGVFIDLKKAFDTIDHYILLQKLYHYCIRGIINDWFHSYLTERVKSTLIDSKVSTKLPTACGVTKGSVLGPLLFLLYVNDLCRSSDKLSFYLFADDTNLLYADRDINSLERVLNAELSKVQEWLVANRLTLNAKKSNFVIFHPHQKKLDRDVILKIFDIETNDFVLLDQKTYIKYLAILIDSNLTWKYHISYITSKISKTIGVIARLRHFVPTSTLLTLYRSFLSPYLLYCLTVWGQAPQIYLNQILVLQKRALRLIYFAPYRSSAVCFLRLSPNRPPLF